MFAVISDPTLCPGGICLLIADILTIISLIETFREKISFVYANQSLSKNVCKPEENQWNIRVISLSVTREEYVGESK